MLLVLLRGLFVACALSGFGAALFAATLMKSRRRSRCGIARAHRRTRALSDAVSLAAALPIALAWLVLEAQDMSGASTLAEWVAAIPEVLLHTSFGHVLALQVLAIAGALAATAIMRWPSLLVAALAGFAVLLEAGHSHAYAMTDPALAPIAGAAPSRLGRLARRADPTAHRGARRPSRRGGAYCSPLCNARVDVRRQCLSEPRSFKAWSSQGASAASLGPPMAGCFSSKSHCSSCSLP